ncbi:hypothetical protein A0H81_03501 [Grifola frondosa]|uniref:Uncharacterized protein n=1 Tax=Grifola frondosa TaxID=5627 RepID=A0A1C7MGS2_GRIFR|nr:hypothetical protein A0H81_03501 [Grifola frondosa]
MKTLPPGIPFLFHNLLTLSFPPAVVLLATRVLRFQHVLVPGWLLVLAIIVINPLLFAARVSLMRWHTRRAAARMGAVLPDALVGRWIGGLDVMMDMLHAFKVGYPPDIFDRGFSLNSALFSFDVLWVTGYVTTDPDIVKTVLALEFPNFEKGEVLRNNLNAIFGTGVFNSDGEMWKFHRSMTRPFFTRERISHFELFDRHADHAISKMKERFQAGIAVDFQDLITRFTFDAATEFLFGSCVNSLDAPLPYPHNCPAHEPTTQPANAAERFSDAVEAVQIVVADRLRAGWTWPLREIFKDKTEEDRAIVDAVLEPIVKEALRKKAEKMNLGEGAGEKDEEDETLLDSLVQLTSDPVILRDETLNILLAGRDTTASALTFAIYLLCEHPAVLKRLREEILQYVGPTRRPTYDNIREMRYLRAFLNGEPSVKIFPANHHSSPPNNFRVIEVVSAGAVRYPPELGNDRHPRLRYTINETLLPNPDPTGKPIYIPAKTKVTYSVFKMHRDPKHWGPDAEAFDPDRFLDSRMAEYFIQNPFIFLPFNGGPRICLGQQFAYNEMSFFVIRLLQSFATMGLDLTAQPPDSLPPPEWKNAAGRKAAEKVFVKAHITLYAHGGLWVQMGDADAEA